MQLQKPRDMERENLAAGTDESAEFVEAPLPLSVELGEMELPESSLVMEDGDDKENIPAPAVEGAGGAEEDVTASTPPQEGEVDVEMAKAVASELVASALEEASQVETVSSLCHLHCIQLLARCRGHHAGETVWP